MVLLAVIATVLILTSDVPAAVDGKCDGNYVQLSGISGTFQTTNYPGNFEADETCRWNISVPSGNIVKLKFSAFVVGMHDSSRCDQISQNVVTVQNTANGLRGTLNLCGDKIPNPVYSFGYDNTMTVQFVSASVELTKGFNASYEAVPQGDLCPQQKQLNSASGSFSSQYFPREYPGNGTTCSWTITAPTAAYLELNFTAFNVENCGLDCNCDHVDVYDGTSSAAKRIGRYCGDDLTDEKSPIVPLYSTQNSFTVTFFTEKGVISGQHYTGFEVVWKESQFTPTVCPSTPVALGGSSGNFSSPRYQDGTYVHGLSCAWLITVPLSSRIKLTFTDFELDEKNPCDKDKVVVYGGGSDSNSKLMEKCDRFGTFNPIVSSGRYMLVKFTSGHSVSYSGFDAKYEVTGDPPSPTLPPKTATPSGAHGSTCNMPALFLSFLVIFVAFLA